MQHLGNCVNWGRETTQTARTTADKCLRYVPCGTKYGMVADKYNLLSETQKNVLTTLCCFATISTVFVPIAVIIGKGSATAHGAGASWAGVASASNKLVASIIGGSGAVLATCCSVCCCQPRPAETEEATPLTNASPP